MDHVIELQIADCQDIWSKLYYYYAHTYIETFKQDGERILRKAIRAFGVDRGTALRGKQEKAGLEINVKNLFTYYDLPDDPRFRRNKIKLTEQERFSETLVCPIADLWIKYGAKKLGRIYCEEFHHAMFGAYEHAFQIDLGQTLTQDEDNHCRFSIYGRPANIPGGKFHRGLPSEEKFTVPDYRSGFETLVIRLSYRMISLALSEFGDKARQPFAEALEDFEKDVADQLIKRAEAMKVQLGADFINLHCPISIMSDTPNGDWMSYLRSGNEEPWKIFYDNVILPLRKELINN